MTADVTARLRAAAVQAIEAMRYPDDRRNLRRAVSALQSAVDRADNAARHDTRHDGDVVTSAP